LFIFESVNNRTLWEAKRNKALLHGFYLNEKDSAIEILQELIHSPMVDNQLKSYCKLDLGDLYLLNEEPWESTLLYSQVEKDQKESTLGYEAKLRNARLSYYNGDFELALSHLDILKEATSREIANNAMELSLRIKDNTVFDTTAAAMKSYAAIELLLFQNQKEMALKKLEELLKTYPGHTLTDEIWWLQANIFQDLGDFDQVVNKLKLIVDNFPEDILGDDAAYLLAKVYEENLADENKAMELYQNFLITYKGSIYVPDARKRFRRLRGDIVN
ncbi:tetratricopeptide repeat protein, partial [Xanthovirga aplysinae]|uniref:tetratricopeptide repeat protein n=1 Tax=Xanthovirga aplysinae TaxID=2529853 RepID=UPI0012BBE630